MPLKIGTDCSGMEAPVQAVQNLGLAVEHLFSCDINKDARTTIQANFPPKRMYADITTRDNASAPQVQLYVCGFPCQPFSAAGKREGFDDTLGRGTIFKDVVRFLKDQKPETFILENVSNLKTLDGGKYFEAIMLNLKSLKNPGYNVDYQVLDTKDHGLPHSRRRIYITGIRKDKDKGTFKFPEPIECPAIDKLLDPKKAGEGQGNKFPGFNQKTGEATVARKNVIQHNQALRKKGVNPKTTTYIYDIGSSPYRSHARTVSPCITCSRSDGHWISSRQRRLSLEEMLRLQGMDPSSFKMAVSKTQLGRQVGNAMSVNVLERLMVRLLPAAGLTAKLTDRWESGEALKKLQKSRGKRLKVVEATEGTIFAAPEAKSRKRSSEAAAPPAKRRR